MSTSITSGSMVWFKHEDLRIIYGHIVSVDHDQAHVQLHGEVHGRARPLPKIVTKQLSVLTPATVAYVDEDVLDQLEPSPRATWW